VWFYAYLACCLLSTDPNPSHGCAPSPGVCVCVRCDVLAIVWMSRGGVCELSKFVCAFGVCKRECAWVKELAVQVDCQKEDCVHIWNIVFFWQVQLPGTVRGRLKTGEALRVCWFRICRSPRYTCVWCTDVQEMCGYVQELWVFFLWEFFNLKFEVVLEVWRFFLTSCVFRVKQGKSASQGQGCPQRESECACTRQCCTSTSRTS